MLMPLDLIGVIVVIVVVVATDGPAAPPPLAITMTTILLGRQRASRRAQSPRLPPPGRREDPVGNIALIIGPSTRDEARAAAIPSSDNMQLRRRPFPPAMLTPSRALMLEVDVIASPFCAIRVRRRRETVDCNRDGHGKEGDVLKSFIINVVNCQPATFHHHVVSSWLTVFNQQIFALRISRLDLVHRIARGRRLQLIREARVMSKLVNNDAHAHDV
jgi:hypothetical protein